MRKIKANTNWYKYLEQRYLLDANDEILQAVKLEYKRVKDREHKRQKRSTEKRNFNISFPAINMPRIKRQTKDYQAKSIPEYLKILVKADLEHNHPMQHTIQYNEILETLQFFKNEIQNGKDKKLSSWLKDANYELLEQKILEVSKTISGLLNKSV